MKLQRALRSALNSLVQDGTYQKILHGWGVADGALKTPTTWPCDDGPPDSSCAVGPTEPGLDAFRTGGRRPGR